MLDLDNIPTELELRRLDDIDADVGRSDEARLLADGSSDLPFCVNSLNRLSVALGAIAARRELSLESWLCLPFLPCLLADLTKRALAISGIVPEIDSESVADDEADGLADEDTDVASTVAVADIDPTSDVANGVPLANIADTGPTAEATYVDAKSEVAAGEPIRDVAIGEVISEAADGYRMTDVAIEDPTTDVAI